MIWLLLQQRQYDVPLQIPFCSAVRLLIIQEGGKPIAGTCMTCIATVLFFPTGTSIHCIVDMVSFPAGMASFAEGCYVVLQDEIQRLGPSVEALSKDGVMEAILDQVCTPVSCESLVSVVL